jgi:hypothetical protein
MRAELVVACVLGAAQVARGEPNPEASRLFEEARALLEQGRAAEACARFAQSYELEHAPGTMLNLGECAERAGELGRAWSLYDEAAREYEQQNRASSARFARGRADALAPKLAVVIVRVAEPGLAGLGIRLGDREVAPAAQIIVRRDPGALAVSARAPGREPYTASVTGEAGQTVTVEVPALRPERAGAAEERPPGRTGWRIAFWASAGVIVLGGASWIYGWSEVRDAEETVCTAPGSTCNPADVPDDVKIAANRRGERGQTITLVAVVAAAVGVGAAGVTFYKGYLAGRGDRARSRTRVAPVVTPSGLGIAVAGRF